MQGIADGISDAVMVLAVLHVLGVILVGALQRENLVRSMWTGWKRCHVVRHKRD